MARPSPSCACRKVGHTERDFCDGSRWASAGGRWRIGVVLQRALGVQSRATSSTSRRSTARRSFSRDSLSVRLEPRRSCRTALGWLETRASPRGSHGLSSPTTGGVELPQRIARDPSVALGRIHWEWDVDATSASASQAAKMATGRARRSTGVRGVASGLRSDMAQQLLIGGRAEQQGCRSIGRAGRSRADP